MPGARVSATADWCRGFDLAQERTRGLTDHEDHVHTGASDAAMTAGVTLRFAASADSLRAQIDRQRAVLAAWQATQPGKAARPPCSESPVLAADQLIARRPDTTPLTWHSGSSRRCRPSMPPLVMMPF